MKDLNGNALSSANTFSFTVPFSTQLGSSAVTGVDLMNQDRDDLAFGIDIDSSNNIYITGHTTGHLDGNTNAGGYDVFLIKYNSNFTKQWTKQIGTNNSSPGTTNDQFGSFSPGDVSYSVSSDGSGNLCVGGTTTGSLDSQSNSGSRDGFIIKYDSSGNKQWTKLVGTSSQEIVHAVISDSSGNCYITGSTRGALSGTNQGNSDVFVAKYNSSGSQQWLTQIGTSAYEYNFGVAVDSNSNVYTLGRSMGGFDSYSHQGNYDILIAKFNSSGTKQWTSQIGSSSYDWTSGIDIDSDGNVYIVGSTNGGIDSNSNTGGYDAIILKYNSSGTKQWSRQFGSSSNDWAMDLDINSSNEIYITGRTNGSLDSNTNLGSYDGFLVKYNSSGTKQWTKQFGTSSIDWANGVAIDSSGNIVVTGYTDGSLDGNSNSGGSDLFLLKFDSSGTKQ